MTKSPWHGRALLTIVLIGVLSALDGRAQSLTAGWASGDVGNPAVTGAASVSNGTFTVTAGGSDIWGRRDELHFVYQAGKSWRASPV